MPDNEELQMADTEKSSLQKSVDDWLSNEGYPLEYLTSNIFEANGFSTRQGFYARPLGSDKPREVDVKADLDFRDEDHLVRLSNIVECKYSKKHPIVVFVSKKGGKGAIANIAQTISSELGFTLLLMVAHKETLHGLSMFKFRRPVGFNARQGLIASEGSQSKPDRLYGAMTSVVSACKAFCEESDQGANPLNSLHIYANLCFPTVVVEGVIFEASYDNDNEKMVTNQVPFSRVEWRGSPDLKQIINIDIVSKDGLRDFVTERKKDITILRSEIDKALKVLKYSWENGDYEYLCSQYPDLKDRSSSRYINIIRNMTPSRRR